MRFLKHKRLIAGVIVVVGIVAAAMWPSSMEVGVTTVARGPLQVTIDEDGVTRIRDRFVVSAPVAGRLQRVELEPGDPVVGGKTVVARLTTAESPLLDPRTRGELTAGVDAARAAVGQAQAERARAAAELERAQTTLRRQQELMKAGAIASDALDAAETAVMTAKEASRAADFTVSRSEYELQLARARLQAPSAAGRAIEVVAPVSGVILKRLRESETVVPVGDPIVEIGDPSRIDIVADFLSTDAVRIPPNAPVLIEQWGGNQPLMAKVRRVEPAGFMKVSALGVEEQRVNVIIDFADPAAAGRSLGDAYRVDVRVIVWREDSVLKVPVGALFRRGEGWASFGVEDERVNVIIDFTDPAAAGRSLGDAYRVDVRVIIWREDNVLKVPVGALFRRGEAWASFVVEDDRARVKTVMLGQRNATEAQVASGLSEGQTVVLHPPDTLTDGMRVTTRPE